MAKVLVVDTNFSSRPILDAITRLGHEVYVVGGNPGDCLAKMWPRYRHLNYADTPALSEWVSNEHFDFLVPGCTDRSYRSCAEVSQGRFPGIDTVEIEQLLNQKARFRSLALQLGLPVPQLQWQDTTETPGSGMPEVKTLSWPLVVKPVDGFSGKGVAVLLRPDVQALQQAVAVARATSASGKCLIEDYKVGQLYSHSAHVQAGRVVRDIFVEEHGTANPFVVDTSWVLSKPSEELRQKLRQSVETLVQHLQLCDGLMHTQFILQGEEPWLIEITRRCPGDLYSQLVELSGHAGYVDNYIRPFLGLDIVPEISSQHVPIMRHTVTVKAEQVFSHLHFHQPLHLERWVPLSLTGDHLQPSPASRIGIMFARAADEDDLKKLCATTLARRLYQVVH